MGEARKPCSQPGLGPPSVLVLVLLLVFLNLIVLRGCKSFLEGGRERDADRQAGQSCDLLQVARSRPGFWPPATAHAL